MTKYVLTKEVSYHKSMSSKLMFYFAVLGALTTQICFKHIMSLQDTQTVPLNGAHLVVVRVLPTK